MNKDSKKAAEPPAGEEAAAPRRSTRDRNRKPVPVSLVWTYKFYCNKYTLPLYLIPYLYPIILFRPLNRVTVMQERVVPNVHMNLKQ